MPENEPLIRVEHLQTLARFFSGVGKALAAGGLTEERCCELMRSGVKAECMQCGIHVSGEELFTLSQPAKDGKGNAKVVRLRLGDCARQGCDSFYYRVTFETGSATDWEAILKLAENPPLDVMPGSRTSLREWVGRILSFRRRVSWRFWAGLGGIALVLLARQVYFGGRIPLLREPENFRVDSLPNEDIER